MTMAVGNKAPDFTLMDSESNEFKFSDLDGEWISQEME